MKIIISIHKDDMFTDFELKRMFTSKNITGEISVGEELYELHKILRVFNDNGYNPQIIITENNKWTYKKY